MVVTIAVLLQTAIKSEHVTVGLYPWLSTRAGRNETDEEDYCNQSACIHTPRTYKIPLYLHCNNSLRRSEGRGPVKTTNRLRVGGTAAINEVLHAAPKVIKTDIYRSDADAIVALLERAGAQARVVPNQ